MMIPLGPSAYVSLVGLIVAAIALAYRFRRQGLSGFAPFNRGRRFSIAGTPPRDLSPERKRTDDDPTSASDGYKDAFPPSSRENLVKILQGVSPTLNQAEFLKNLVPFASDYRYCGPSTYTCTGVSIEEIKSLGDFPDYATLSGVPPPNEYKDFKVEKALAKPYRPFRWAYHQTMSLTKLETDWWLEVEKNYASTIQQRLDIYEKNGKSVLDYLPGSELATKELMEMALQFYCVRYPQYFALHKDPVKGHVFKNGILKSETVIRDHHPLHVLLRNIPEDFAVMLRNPSDGYYYLRAGVICSALGWNLGVKLGLQLKEIHSPIPDYKEKMEFSMDRYFSKMPPQKPIQRGSWGLEIDKPLFMPPGDPHETHRETQHPTLPLSRIHLRVDWQTLRRLPLSGAVVFNFKGLFTPISDFRDEAYIPALVRKVLCEGKRSIMLYKNTWHVEHVVIPALRAWEEEQVSRGLVEEEWEVATLKESPFYPGWEERWRARQGFGP